MYSFNTFSFDVVFSRFTVNTTKKIAWAVRLFEDWIISRSHGKNPEFGFDGASPFDALDKMQLNLTLSRFIQEVRKQDGSEYYGGTLKDIVICIQMHLKEKNMYDFFKDPDFFQLVNTLDNVMKSQAQAGIGTVAKQAQIITVQEENKLWETGVLGSDKPETLVDTLFYLIGMHFALRGGQEHRNLRGGDTSQLKI